MLVYWYSLHVNCFCIFTFILPFFPQLNFTTSWSRYRYHWGKGKCSNRVYSMQFYSCILLTILSATCQIKLSISGARAQILLGYDRLGFIIAQYKCIMLRFCLNCFCISFNAYTLRMKEMTNTKYPNNSCNFLLYTMFEKKGI